MVRVALNLSSFLRRSRGCARSVEATRWLAVAPPGAIIQAARAVLHRRATTRPLPLQIASARSDCVGCKPDKLDDALGRIGRDQVARRHLGRFAGSGRTNRYARGPPESPARRTPESAFCSMLTVAPSALAAASTDRRSRRIVSVDRPVRRGLRPDGAPATIQASASG